MPPPSLASLTFGDFDTALAARLGDSVFWSAAERKVYILEAFRTWNAAAQFWRDRGTFPTVAATAFYDLPSALPTLLGQTRKDQDLVTSIEYHLLEPPTPTVWTGTSMFSLADVTGALERRRDQFLVETGAVLTHYTAAMLPPPSGRAVFTNNSVIDVRRAAWKSATNVYTHLWRTDEHELNAYLRGWSTDPDTPQAYSVIANQPFRMQLAPVPLDAGTLDLVVVAAGATLDPATGVLLGVPDDFDWVVKWGALADLLGREGVAQDAARSAYCEMRWREGIALARVANTVIQCQINGVPLMPGSQYDLDTGYANWQNESGAPENIAMSGLNLLTAAAVPDGVYSITLDVVRNAEQPSVAVDPVHIGREQFDVLLDYAQHLALFKCGGAEFEATADHYSRLVRAAATFNSRLRASARNFRALSETSMREAKQRPRRFSDVSLAPISPEKDLQ